MKGTMTRYQTPNGFELGLLLPIRRSTSWAKQRSVDVRCTATRDKLIAKMHETAVADAHEIFIAHDLNPRAISPKVQGFVQAQSWFQDLTPITSRPDLKRRAPTLESGWAVAPGPARSQDVALCGPPHSDDRSRSGFGVTLICFALIYLAPGDPVQSLLPPDATAKDIAELQHALRPR